MNEFKNPLYSIYPHIYCSGTILINDIPVMEWNGEETKGRGGYGGNIDINNVLLQIGKYKVVGKMFPRKGNKTLVETDGLLIDFYCADKDNWKATRKQFHPKIESPWDGLSENINHSYYEI